MLYWHRSPAFCFALHKYAIVLWNSTDLFLFHLIIPNHRPLRLTYCHRKSYQGLSLTSLCNKLDIWHKMTTYSGYDLMIGTFDNITKITFNYVHCLYTLLNLSSVHLLKHTWPAIAEDDPNIKPIACEIIFLPKYISHY